MKKSLILSVGLIFVLTGCSLTASLPQNNSIQPPVAKNSSTPPVACPMDAKVCPDGSSVGRIGPNCEFAACPPVSVETATTSLAGKPFENQYLRVTIPSGWKLSEATQTIQDQTYDQATGKTTLVGKPVTTKTGGINLIKDNYILYINPQAQQASGVIGGRFAEISMGAPSADGVITFQPSEPCGSMESFPAFMTYKRVDLYVNNQEKRDWCVSPANGSTVWYFSYITDNQGGYFNYYQNGGPLGLVITMAYNSKDVNKLPVAGSATLKSMLDQMTAILKTLQIKQQ